MLDGDGIPIKLDQQLESYNLQTEYYPRSLLINKLLLANIDHWLPKGHEEGITKWREETFGDDGYGPYLDCGDDFIGATHILKHNQIVHPIYVWFIIICHYTTI